VRWGEQERDREREKRERESYIGKFCKISKLI